MPNNPVKRKVISRFPVAPDLEIAVSMLSVKDERMLEIRNFVPSQKSYGRGVVIPAELANDVAAALRLALS